MLANASGNALSSSQFSVGDLVFFRHAKHSWVLGNVASIDGPTITCKSDDAKRQCVGDTTQKLRPEVDVTSATSNLVDENVADLLHLTVLHESTLLRCLYLRYMSDVIYTNVGAIVVAFNPFSFTIPHYQDSCMREYLNAPAEGSPTLLPHTWATAHVTYYELLASFAPQFILVSGESGAGKTEASKIVVKYLSAMSSGKGTKEEEEQSKQCGAKMQRCSPILEAFGNAKTVRNDNSSRFGKFMKIQFTTSGVLCGSFTERYLLEKSRIVTAGEGERVYHSFYLMLRGVGNRLSIPMKPESHYKSINSGGVLRNGDFDTEGESDEVIASMRIVGLDTAGIQSTWCVTAGILHFLNLNFDPDESGSGAVLSSGTSEDAFAAANYWGVPASDLATELLQSALVIRNEVSFKRHSPVVAADCRDAVCKALYDRLFDWLVSQCNRLCDAPNPAAVGGWVGLLDIFGFEDFKINSFEQLCINLANESLQGHYNLFVFEKDMEECRAEGINTVNIPCPNNRPCLDLVQDAKKGILALLDDQSAMATGTNQQFVDACVGMHGDGKSPDFVVERTKRECFSIRHYAGTVRYDSANWVEKNRDTLKDGMRLLMRSSKDPVIATLLDAPAEQVAGGKAKRTFVSTFFRQQLTELMAIIHASNPHWIRCVKPHPAKKPRMFDGMQAMAQLESSGVLGTVKIRKAGFPVRMLYAKFVERFLIMSPSFRSGPPPSKKDRDAIFASRDRARKITAEIVTSMGMLDVDVAQLGTTKLFMKADALTKMELLRRQFIANSTVLIKQVGRGYLTRCRQGQQRIVRAVQCIVAEYRNYCSRCAADRAERAKKQAALVRAIQDGAADLEAAFSRAVLQEIDHMSPPRVAGIEAFIRLIEGHSRAIISMEASAAWALMIGDVAYDFLIAQEEIKRHVLCNSSDFARERHYLILYAYDTLLDDWIEEEEYQRLQLEDEEASELQLRHNRPLFVAQRNAIVVEQQAAYDAMVRQWGRDGNTDIVAQWFSSARDRICLGRSDSGPTDGAAQSSCEVVCRRLLEADELRHRTALQGARAADIAMRRSAAVVSREATERLSLAQIEHRYWNEIAARVAYGNTAMQESLWWGACLRESRRLSGEEAHARQRLLGEFFCGLDTLDLQELCQLESRTRQSIEKRERRGFTDVSQGTRQTPPPKLFAQWSKLWANEAHWRHAMQLLEVKQRHALAKLFIGVRDLWRREHWLRRVLFLMRSLHVAEMFERLRLCVRESTAMQKMRRSAWESGIALRKQSAGARRLEMDAQRLLFDNLRLSDLESMILHSPRPPSSHSV